MDNKRVLAARRENIADEVFAAVREKLLAFTKTPEYAQQLKTLFQKGYEALNRPQDVVVYLRREDMELGGGLSALVPGVNIELQPGNFLLGGVILDAVTQKLRVDESFDTALGDLDGHFAELFGLSLIDR